MTSLTSSTSPKNKAFRNLLNAPRNSFCWTDLGRFLALVLVLASGIALYGESRVAERKVPPIYPAAAKQLRLGGTVKVTATINAAGTVTKAEAKGANRLLGDAAEDAVRKWKFAPGDGETIQEIEIIFKVAE